MSRMNFDYQFQGSGSSKRRQASDPLRLLVLADLRGQSSERPPLASRRPVVVDGGDVDEALAAMSPVAGIELGGGRVDVTFEEMEDFHPDAVFKVLPVFKELRELRGRLANPSTFADAAKSISDFASGDESSSGGEESGEVEVDASDFSRLLGGDSAAPPPSPGSTQVDQLIQGIVGPHIVPAKDPRQDEYVQTIDDS
ncbi:MAG: type VI secretion system contractile sheath small subunit, partial [Planctomycetota bacterium]